MRHPLTLLTREVRPITLTRTNACVLLQDLHHPFADPVLGWLAVRAHKKVLLREFDEYFSELESVTLPITEVLNKARAVGLPVAFSCLGHRKGGGPSGFQVATGWLWDLDGPDGRFPASWSPVAGEPVFTKPSWGALANPEVDRYLSNAGLTNVLVMGSMLDFGIRQTCNELTDRDIGSLVVSDGVIALTSDARSAVTGNMGHGLTKFRTAGEVVNLLAELELVGSVLI